MSYSVDHRRGSDLAFLWLWHRQACTAPIRPLTWELLYALGMALKRRKKKKKDLATTLEGGGGRGAGGGRKWRRN